MTCWKQKYKIHKYTKQQFLWCNEIMNNLFKLSDNITTLQILEEKKCFLNAQIPECLCF